jgi:hypothetical protein
MTSANPAAPATIYAPPTRLLKSSNPISAACAGSMPYQMKERPAHSLCEEKGIGRGGFPTYLAANQTFCERTVLSCTGPNLPFSLTHLFQLDSMTCNDILKDRLVDVVIQPIGTISADQCNSRCHVIISTCDTDTRRSKDRRRKIKRYV